MISWKKKETNEKDILFVKEKIQESIKEDQGKILNDKDIKQKT